MLDKILECLESSLTKYSFSAPYEGFELSDGRYNYIGIKQSEYRVHIYLYEELDFSKDKYTILELKKATESEIANILTSLEQKITKKFFAESYTGKFKYKLHGVLEFNSGRKEFFLVNQERKVELKQHYDKYITEVISNRTRKMQEYDWASVLEKAFDFELTGYTESQLTEILLQGLEAAKATRKKDFIQSFQDCMMSHCNTWKEKTFLPLYYNIEKVTFFSNSYTLKENIKVDTEKLDFFVQQALWAIQFQKYSWDVPYAKEDLDRAAKDFKSEKAKMYLKKGSGLLPESLIHYKDEEVECKANDIFATISVTIKQENASAYRKALDFSINLLQNNFPRSYGFKLSSKAEKSFIKIKGIAQSSTNRFFAQALQYQELHPKLVEYAEVAMVEFQWYNDVAPGEKSCMPGSYAVFGLGLISEAYFPLVLKYFNRVDDEHQMVHKYFVEALISRYGITQESLPVICDGIDSAQFRMKYKELKKAMQLPENKALLEEVLKGKSANYKEEVYYAIK